MTKTEETRDQRILRLHVHEGMSVAAIGSQEGLTGERVGQIIRNQGGVVVHDAARQSARYRDEYRDRVIALHQRGERPGAIAREVGIHHGTVTAILSEADSTRPRVGRPSAKDELLPRAIAMSNRKMVNADIAREIGVSVSTLSRWFSSAGHKSYVDHSGRSKNFGGDPREVGKRGGEAAAAKMHQIECEQCSKPFTRSRSETSRRSRARFCSIECSSAYRIENGGRRRIYTCETCGESFEAWARQYRRYCSRACMDKRRGTSINVDGVGLDSGWEALFYGLMMFLKIRVERNDRERGVEWTSGHWYSPDFMLPELLLHVEVKGMEDDEDPTRWQVFRAHRGPLAIIDRDALDRLRTMNKSQALDCLGSLGR